jgi:hypothetical protein
MLEIGSSEKSSCGKGSPLPESHEMTKSGRKQCGFLCKALWRLVEKFFGVGLISTVRYAFDKG